MKKLALGFLVFSIFGLLNAQLNELKSAREQNGIFKPATASKGLSASTARLDSSKTEKWSGTSWDLISRMKYTYSKTGNTTSVIYQKWDAGTLFNWQNLHKEDTTVNTAGRLIQVITSDWIENQWAQQLKAEFSYNGSGDIVDMMLSRNDPVNGWTNTYRIELIYTDSKLRTEIDYSEAGGVLVKTVKYEYSYPNDSTTILIKSDWAGSDWDKKYKFEQAFNKSGKMISETEYKVIFDLVTFEKIRKTGFSYDVNGNMITQMGYIWGFTPEYLQDWLRTDSIASSYDASNRRTDFAMYDWDKNTSKWTPDYKIETSFGETPVMNITLTHFFGLGAGWTPVERTTSYYSSATTGLINKAETADIFAFPNPASDYVEFRIPSEAVSVRVELYDSGGRKILDRLLPDDRRLPLGKLDRGMYIYRIKSEGFTYSGKILVEK